MSIGELGLYQRDLLQYIDSVPEVLYQESVREAAAATTRHPRFARYGPQDITFGLVDTCSINCYAALFQGRYYVAMSAMVPFCLLELASWLLARKDVLPELGNPSAGPKLALDGVEATPFFQVAQGRFIPRLHESINEHEAELLYRSAAMLRGNAQRFDHETGEQLKATLYLEQFHTLFDFLMPACPVRRYHVEYLVNVMSTYFWIHEITHVTNGHLDLLSPAGEQRRGLLREFPETGEFAAQREQHAIDGQTQLSMELDADLEALMITIGLILEGRDDEGRSKLDPYEKVRLFVFMLLETYMALACEEAKRQDAPTAHPPAHVRLLHLGIYCMHLASGDPKLDQAVHSAVTLAKETIWPGVRALYDIGSLGDDEIKAWMNLDAIRNTDHVRQAGDANVNLRFLVWAYLEGKVHRVPLGEPPSASSSPSPSSSPSSS